MPINSRSSTWPSPTANNTVIAVRRTPATGGNAKTAMATKKTRLHSSRNPCKIVTVVSAQTITLYDILYRGLHTTADDFISHSFPYYSPNVSRPPPSPAPPPKTNKHTHRPCLSLRGAAREGNPAPETSTKLFFFSHRTTVLVVYLPPTDTPKQKDTFNILAGRQGDTFSVFPPPSPPKKQRALFSLYSSSVIMRGSRCTF